MLLFELLYLLQGEEGSASPPHWLLRVSHRPLFKSLGMATLHMQTQILPMLGHEVTHFTGKGLFPCRQTEWTRCTNKHTHSWNNFCKNRLTCVFDGQMGHQELLFRSGVLAVVTLERPVVGMGQLMVEQQLLVVTSVVTKLTLEPGPYKLKVFSKWWYHHKMYEKKEGGFILNTDLLSPRLWMWVSRCILKVYRFLKDLPHYKDGKESSSRDSGSLTVNNYRSSTPPLLWHFTIHRLPRCRPKITVNLSDVTLN